jgi:short-subunit dehydrogenase
VVPYFEAQRAGHVIVIGSIVGKRGLPGYVGYSAAKFAQTGLADALRAELRGAGIAVTTVFPVSVATELREAMTRDFGVRVEGGGGPSQRAEEVARAVMRAMRTRAPEVYPWRYARFLAWLTAVAPSVGDRIAVRAARARRTGTPASSP